VTDEEAEMSDDVSSWNQAGDGGSETTGPRSPGASERELAALRAEVGALRDAARISPQRTRELEARLAHVQTSLSTLSTQNERLVRTLKEAREQIVTLKKEVDRLAQPPSTYGLVMDAPEDGAVDILTGGRKMRVAVSPSVEVDQLGLGREVMLNEALNVVSVHGFERVGEVVTVKDKLDDHRVVVVTHGDEERVCRLANPLIGEHIRVGDSLTLDARSNFVHEVIPKLEVEELVLEEVPDVAY
jgi:proteasome-associated ATPase